MEVNKNHCCMHYCISTTKYGVAYVDLSEAANILGETFPFFPDSNDELTG